MANFKTVPQYYIVYEIKKKIYMPQNIPCINQQIIQKGFARFEI